LILMVYSYL